MKKLMTVALLAVMLSACTETTEFGNCIGALGPEDPELIYKYDAWNIAIGIVFSETMIVPIMVALDGYKCPVATTRVEVEQPTQPTSYKGDSELDDDFVVAIVGGIVLSLLSLAFVYWLVVKKFRIGFSRRK